MRNKNIHLIPKDKPSKLINLDNQFNLNLLLNSTIDKRCVNIYITSDEEIKEGDWFIHSSHGTTTFLKCKSTNSKEIIDNEDRSCWLEYSHKIILTTDQDLIKDGVQAIDDEFLEWFVKNPDCEWVEIDDKLLKKCYTYYRENVLKNKNLYKIIIPKELKTNLEKLPFPELIKEFAEYYKNIPLIEEPKQTVQEYEQQGLEKHSHELESKQECVHDIVTKFGIAECQNCGLEESEILSISKQETLEEAAKREIPELKHTINSLSDARRLWVNGAKWQQEQDKNKYSEEDMNEYAIYVLLNDVISPRQWFEQFKKK